MFWFPCAVAWQSMPMSSSFPGAGARQFAAWPGRLFVLQPKCSLSSLIVSVHASRCAGLCLPRIHEFPCRNSQARLCRSSAVRLGITHDNQKITSFQFSASLFLLFFAYVLPRVWNRDVLALPAVPKMRRGARGALHSLSGRTSPGRTVLSGMWETN